ncbi:unnamed protein product, partial [Didymodactylos carnosus]
MVCSPLCTTTDNCHCIDDNMTNLYVRVYETLKLCEKEIYIQTKLDKLLKIQEDYLHKQWDLEKKEQSLCKILDASPLGIDNESTVGLLPYIEKLQNHLLTLEALKALRLQKLAEYRQNLLNSYEKLQLEPSSIPSISLLLNECYDQYLTEEALNNIQIVIKDLDNQIQLQKDHFHQLRQTLTSLYGTLKITEDNFCLAFNETSVNSIIIKQLESEIERCRAERMKNAQTYVDNIRTKILNEYEKCQVGISERNCLIVIDNEKLSPEKLDKYDRELERLEQLYIVRQPIIDSYKLWLNTWNEFVKFNQWSKSSERFHERGYMASKEVQQRKYFNQLLPKLEEDLLKKLQIWKNENTDCVFLLNDKSIKELFDEIKDEKSLQKTINTVSEIKTDGDIKKKPLLIKTQSKKISVAKSTIVESKPVSTGVSSQSKVLKVPATNHDQTTLSSFEQILTNSNGHVKALTSTPNSSLTTILASSQVVKRYKTQTRKSSKRLQN